MLACQRLQVGSWGCGGVPLKWHQPFMKGKRTRAGDPACQALIKAVKTESRALYGNEDREALTKNLKHRALLVLTKKQEPG